MEVLKWILIVLGIAVGAVVVGYLLIWAISPLFIRGEEYDKNSKFYRWLLNSSTGIATKILRIKFHNTGFEKIPTDTRFLLVCNHRSNYDPILSWYAFRKFTPAYISKPENFKIPIYGRIIRKCCFMAIDRGSARNSMKTVIRAVKLLKSNEVSVAVYPEGTRSKKLKLLKFHNGMFKIAEKAQVPVVVAVITGTETVKERYPFHTSHIHIDVLDVIPYSYIAENGTDATSDLARSLMIEKLKEYGEENE